MLIVVSAIGGPVPSPAGASTACPYEVVLAHADGSVSVLGPAGQSCPNDFHGSMAGQPLNQPIVGMAATPGGGGYWLVAADGGIFAFGNAQFYGSMGGQHLNQPIVGMAPTPNGGGYWLVAADGGLFAFGNAQFYGSMGGQLLNKPVVGMAADGSTGGYWEVASDGGIFAFNAPFLGSMGGKSLNAPIGFMAGTPDFAGYRMVGTDGGVFDFGDAQFYGSAAAPGSSGWDALTATPGGGGYWLFSNTSSASFGDAASQLTMVGGNASAAPVVGAATLALASTGGGAPTTTPATGGWLNDVSCPSISRCVAVGQSGSGGALVEVSNDGGRSFASAGVPSAPALHGVTCPDVTHCYAVGGSEILASDDGGQNWTATSAGSYLTGVACQSDTTCTAVGNNLNGGVYSFLYTTNGSTWSSSTEVPNSAAAQGVSCTPTACIAVGNGVYRSANGGQSWSVEGIGGGTDDLANVSCIPSTTTCLADSPGFGFNTTSRGQLAVITADGAGGSNESSNLPGSTEDIVGIACTAGDWCAATGFSGPTGGATFLRTPNAGTTWSAPTVQAGFVAPGGFDVGLGIACPSATTCVLVGDGGSRAVGAVTTNGGATWTASSVR